MKSESPESMLANLQRRLQRTLPMGRLEVADIPQLPEIKLALINADFPVGPLPAETMRAVIAQPAYWSFCWGSGRALARYLLDQPNRVAGLKVVDLGAGSGVVAISAALAGASEIWACDNDGDALQACRTNATLNGIEIRYCSDINKLPDDLDLILMADVLYDRSNFTLIEQAKRRAPNLLIADSRVNDVEDPGFIIERQMQALTYPNLGEFDEFKNVRFFAYAGKSAATTL